MPPPSFVHGLGWDATTKTLASIFCQYGEIEEYRVIVDCNTGRSKGYGFAFLTDADRCPLPHATVAIGCHPPLRRTPISLGNLVFHGKAAIEIVSNPVQHDRTKYIEIDRHFIKEKINQDQICITYIRSSDHMVDILIKGLSSSSFSGLIDKMGLRDIFTSSLKGVLE
uniref:UBP1-associated protein 2A-like n=1 Tax=Elaeis guineensis var. tenera TaxID=51953 RepID=A0A6I9R9C2_ELAGV|nr:UBP1-associated protein 2A-like [Elaeis guineensis]